MNVEFFKVTIFTFYIFSQNIWKDKIAEMRKNHQLIYLFTIIVTFHSFPSAIGFLICNIFTRIEWIGDVSILVTPLMILEYTVYIVCPLSYAVIIENMSLAKICVPGFRSKRNITPNVRNTTDNESRTNSNINTPVQEACANLSKITWVKIEENYYRHGDIEMKPLVNLAGTRNPEILSFAATKTDFESIEL